MTAPSPSRAERTAERLRQAAREAFAELGWSATRVEDIVGRAGVSHGTFYTYYENKAAALGDLVRTSREEVNALAAAPWGQAEVRAELEMSIGGFLDLYARDLDIMRTWLDAARDEAALADLLLSSRALFVDHVAEHFETELRAVGRRDVPGLRTVASALVAMVEQSAYCWLVLGEPYERGQAVEVLVLIWESAFNALAAAAAEPAGVPSGV